uniref:Translation initiation factor eIF2B subunit epsilon n=1 Tax=Kalanchoe fedtschenkoi TaxID=63787 RepID=A0A7N0TQL7_KALFE
MLQVLLPLVNVPMINYTLAWLESAGVEEVFVFCCAHSRQVIDYLEASEWMSQPNFTVSTIESRKAISAGDALRFIYERNVIHGDFVLISGDTVSNMSLNEALKEHKDRRKKDNNAIMTMVIQRSKPSPITHQSRLGTDELFLAIDPETMQLLYYEDKDDSRKGTISIDKTLIADNPTFLMHNDKQDCYIDICSPEVLSLFSDNFDYQHLRKHFVKGLLVDDIMGYKIFTYEIHSSYAARIDNFRSYDTISKDIIQRWTYPFVPDVKFFGNSAVKLDRQGMYRASEVGLSRSAKCGPFTVIGCGTNIGTNTVISDSVIGEGCTIGSNVSIEGSYVWNNVVIEDGCKLKHAIVCDGVMLRSGAVLNPGVVLSFNVVIGQKFVVPAYSMVSLLEQPTNQDSDEELEYADNNSDSDVASDEVDERYSAEVPEKDKCTAYEVGESGAGYIWQVCDGVHEEDWRHSVAPIPDEKLIELMQKVDLDTEDNLPSSGELKPELNSNMSDDDDDDIEEVQDDTSLFQKEVEATFLRAVHENVAQSHIVLEVNALRLSFNMTFLDCASALFYSMIKLALDTPHNSSVDLRTSAAALIRKWKKLLKGYLTSIDEEIEVILKFEEMCLESKELAPSFTQLLHLMYDEDIVQEESILNWAAEKENADEKDKEFVKQAEQFLQWLKEAPEEDDDDD